MRGYCSQRRGKPLTEIVKVGGAGEGASGGDSRVDCESCAAVCCRFEVLLFGETGVPAWLIDTRTDGSQVMGRLDDGWCAALDRRSMRCSIYAERPLICREFEMGGTDCVDARQDFSEIRLVEN
jgi:Fe-S-cluster containining protein